jgi:hypothetical protein
MASFLQHVPKGEYDSLLKNIARVITRPIPEGVAAPMRQELQKLNWPDAVDVCENLMRMGRTVLSNSLWVVMLEEIEKTKERYAVRRNYQAEHGETEVQGDKDLTYAFLRVLLTLFRVSDRRIFLKLNKRLRDINNQYGDNPATKEQAINEMNALYYEAVASKSLKVDPLEIIPEPEVEVADEFVF